MTRARLGVSLALSLIFVCLGAPVASAMSDFDVWGAEDVNAPAAWTLSRGAGVTVAVVDTGVMADHDELKGRVDLGWTFDGVTGDTVGHGTAVAAVIAADADNNKGIKGVAPDASILSYRAFAGSGSQNPDDIAHALDLAGDSDARVVNASFGTAPYTDSGTYRNDLAAIDRVLAAHPDTLYVAAAGNESNDNDARPVLPCDADVPNLICVGAYDPDRVPLPETNYGDGVTLYAPGFAIKSATIPFSNSYKFFTGTSMSAAFVSGVAALLFAEVPQLTPQAAIKLMLTTSHSVEGSGSKPAGVAGPDALAALQEAVADRDHDGIYDVLDDCLSPDGCPDPTPAPTPTPSPVPSVTPAGHADPVPQLRSLTAKVSPCRAHRPCRKSVTVKLAPDRAARVSLRVERQVCRHGRCRWSRVLSKAVTASTRGASVVVRGKRSTSLPKGLYRVTAVPSSRAGTGRTATRTVRVR